MKIPSVYLIAGGAVAAALAYVYIKGPKSAGASIGGAAVDLVDGVVSGAVVQVGEAVGIPATNMNECERAKAMGDTWEASFKCPAGDFLKYVWN